MLGFMRMRRLSVLALLVCGAGGCPASDDAASDDAATEGTTSEGTASASTVADDTTSEGGGCEDPDDSTRSALVLEIGDYPVDVPDDYRLDDVPCTVALLDTTQPMVVRTELSCDAPGGTTHTIVIEHASSDLGQPRWSTGDELLLTVDYTVYTDLNDNPLFAVRLSAADGALRLFAVDSDTLLESVATPLGLSLDPMACGLEPGTESHRGLLTLSLDGTSVQVSDANDATLVTSAGTHAVELESAIYGDFGERSLFFELLVMQVQ